MRVYFSPTKTNCQVIALAKQRRELQGCTFEPLSENIHERVQQLRGIGGRAAFLWGDGRHHHESYFFTPRQVVEAKVNLDHHSDLTSDGFISFYGHMAHSRDAGIEVVTPNELDHDTNRLVSRALKAAARLDGAKLAVTVDCDIIPCFPVHREWILYDGFDRGLRTAEILDLVAFLAPRIARLDIGGMVEDAGPFEFTETREPPRFIDVLRLSSRGITNQAAAVASFGMTFYLDMLTTFARFARIEE